MKNANHHQEDKLASFLKTNAPIAPAGTKAQEVLCKNLIFKESFLNPWLFPILATVSLITASLLFLVLSEENHKIPSANEVSSSKILYETFIANKESNNIDELYVDWDLLAENI